MSSAIYRKLALTNIKNNRRTCVPYLLTCVITVMMFYIIYALTINKGIRGVPGESTFRMMLGTGVGIVGIFSVIFLFYTNSFLIKQRKKEIGIYNVLGLGKRHIAKMLVVEMVITVCVSFAGGILGGIVFGKLVFLILLRILHFDIGLTFAVEPKAVALTMVLFAGIFLACLLYNLFQIRLANPIELLRGGNVGEREPKTKKVMTLAGIFTLGGGYFIALTVKNPMDMILYFFVAVILVVIGTYALFTAGSIAVLKLMRKNKNYYYQTRHFTSVSGMMYRMKQNAAGLANICILSTMVLVMVSSTAALYVGMDDILRTRFPKECIIEAHSATADIRNEVDKRLANVLAEHGLTPEDKVSYMSETGQGLVRDNRIEVATRDTEADYKSWSLLYFLTAEEYNRMTGRNIALAEDEVLTYGTNNQLKEGTLVINEKAYKNKKTDLSMADQNTQIVMPGYYIVMADQKQLDSLKQRYSESLVTEYYTAMDLTGKKADKEAAYEEIKMTVRELGDSVVPELRETERDDFYSLYGVFLFLGIFFGGLFLMATILIIYYKQISEGYSDRERFQIMRKVGMSDREVKQSIRSQVLSVFFLPLVVAVIHIAAAFKAVTKLLAALNLTNVHLTLLSTVVTVVVFAVFYAIVFGITTKEYYRIVKDDLSES